MRYGVFHCEMRFHTVFCIMADLYLLRHDKI